MPLNIQDQESIEELVLTIDNAIQYGEDLDVKMKVSKHLNSREKN